MAGGDVVAGIEGTAGNRAELDIVLRDAGDVGGDVADAEQLAVGVGAGAQAHVMHHLRLRPDHPIHMLSGEHELHRPTHDLRGHRRQDFVRPDEGLGAEAASGMRGDNADLCCRQAERGGQGVLHRRQMLHGVVNSETIPVPSRDGVTGQAYDWEFHNGRKITTVPTKSRLMVSDAGTMFTECIAGTGVAQVVAVVVRDLLENGSLIQLFPDWSDETFPLYAYHPSRHHPAAKVRAFVDFVLEAMH